MKTYSDLFKRTISAENLFVAYFEFRKGKHNRKDVMDFEYQLEQNIFDLQRELQSHSYRHGPYHGFYITDPKQRHIHKASVRDRIIHHAIFSALNPFLEKTFIFDSYSCRKAKGTHKGVDRLGVALRRASSGNRKPCVALKCDVKKFFASVDHKILIDLLDKRIADKEMLWLLREVIESFQPGLPIGNLTSQLFANFYMNELDQFVKHRLKIRFYLRYTDDFVIIADSKSQLEVWLQEIRNFLKDRLNLDLHPHKITFRTYGQGVDFLGYVQFPQYRLLRGKTKRRILKKVREGVKEEALQSYLGVLSHADAHRLSERIKNEYWLSKEEIK